MQAEEPRAGERQRIDRWLHCARVVKSRSLAAKLAASGKVRINREKTGQASQLVRTGDVLTITLDQKVLVYRVLQMGGRRGPAIEARLLYEDLTPPATVVQTEAARDSGSGRPTKKDRRAIDRLRSE